MRIKTGAHCMYKLLLSDFPPRIFAKAKLIGNGGEESKEITVLVDTGAPNTIISSKLIENYGEPTAISKPLAIGGEEYEAAFLHIIPKVMFKTDIMEFYGDFICEDVAVFVTELDERLSEYMILGLNVLNNWLYSPDREINTMTVIERTYSGFKNKFNKYANWYNDNAGEYETAYLLNPRV